VAGRPVEQLRTHQRPAPALLEAVTRGKGSGLVQPRPRPDVGSKGAAKGLTPRWRPRRRAEPGPRAPGSAGLPPRWAAVVAFPTPPFWLTIAKVRRMVRMLRGRQPPLSGPFPAVFRQHGTLSCIFDTPEGILGGTRFCTGQIPGH